MNDKTDPRIILREKYFKETGRRPEIDIKMYCDWLELQLLRDRPPVQEMFAEKLKSLNALNVALQKFYKDLEK